MEETTDNDSSYIYTSEETVKKSETEKKPEKAKYKVIVDTESFGELAFMVIANPNDEEKSVNEEIEWRMKKYDISKWSIVEYKRRGIKED